MSLGIAIRTLQLLRLLTFNYQPGVRKNLRGIDNICVAYNVYFLLLSLCNGVHVLKSNPKLIAENELKWKP